MSSDQERRNGSAAVAELGYLDPEAGLHDGEMEIGEAHLSGEVVVVVGLEDAGASGEHHGQLGELVAAALHARHEQNECVVEHALAVRFDRFGEAIEEGRKLLDEPAVDGGKAIVVVAVVREAVVAEKGTLRGAVERRVDLGGGVAGESESLEGALGVLETRI